MALTAKMQVFCQESVNGKNISDAYRAAYKTDDMKPVTINGKAWKLNQRSDIRGRIAELKKKLADKNLWTREKSVRVLSDIADNAEKDSDKVSAVKELNSMHGFKEAEKHDHTSSDGSMSPSKDRQTRAEIEAEIIKAGFDPKKVALDE